MINFDKGQDKSELMGHPIGLFVLFFTEMWERFSYYGMRALLILFLISELSKGGWGWDRKEAFALYGWYVMLVYFLPMLGGWLADNKWGHVKTVVIGASIITAGHAALAISDINIDGFDLKFVFYIGLLLLVVGTGLFKPNMSSIVGKMYPPHSKKKDGAYTIFYMGVNSGAFIGTLLVGWIGEHYGWKFGFGLAGIFMLFGLLQFYFAREIFGEAANKPQPKNIDLPPEELKKRVPFTETDKILAGAGVLLALTWVVHGLYNVISGGSYFLPLNIYTLNFSGNQIHIDLTTIFFFLSIIILIILGLSRLKRYEPVERDRLTVIFIIAFFVIAFWASFEQAGTTMNIFARDYTNRVLSDHWAMIYKIIDTIISIAPMLVLSYVIFGLAYKMNKYPLTVIFTTISFIIIWILVILRVRDKVLSETPIVDTTWFQILNPVFIISLAPLYSKIWKKYNVPAAKKFFIGFVFLGSGFAMLAIAASSIPPGAKTASVSMVWLIVAYLFHTMGELAISPVGLSYVSKLAPIRMTGFLFGIWYIFTGLANKLSGLMAEASVDIADKHGLSVFFLIFTFVPFIAGLLILSLNGFLKRRMHGVE
jgi:POT family proton-dependent oligopeptide transporter